MLQSFRIFVDGDKVASVGNGATIRVPVPPGRHAVQVRSYFTKPDEVFVDVVVGQRVVVECEIRGQSESSRTSYMCVRQVVKRDERGDRGGAA